MPRLDPHSFHDTEQPSIVHFSLKAHVDFDARRLDGEVVLRLAAPASAGPLDLDTRDLDIRQVADNSGRPLRHTLSAPEPILGARLRVDLPPGIQEVRISYRTHPEASALQWLAPEQTIITSTCGFNHLPRHIAFGKLRAMTEAKAILTGNPA